MKDKEKKKKRRKKKRKKRKNLLWSHKPEIVTV